MSRLAPAPWRKRPGLAALCAQLGAAQGEARFVGGAVRDTLLGLPVRDVDIATLHRPEEVMARLRSAGIKVVPTGIAHGTVTAVIGGGPVEITTLRRDVATDGRHATIAFCNRWEEDAARRDFTINALYADPVSGDVEDYFGGLDDLAARRVRFIGDPARRIAEDHLRILRFYRFTARFGTLDRAGPDHAACVAHANRLMALSRERIADELLKLLALPDPADMMAAMVADGILRPVLPEIDAGGAAALAALVVREQAMALPPDGVRRLAALLPADAALAEPIGARLKLSGKARARLTSALGDGEADTPRALAYRIGTTGALDRIALGRAFSPADAATLRDWTPPRLPIGGGELIAMGVPQGPEVARALRAVEKAWIAAGFPDREAALEMARSTLGLRS